MDSEILVAMGQPAQDVPDAETVEELSTIVAQWVADERSRGQALDAKTASLAGFSGTILALTATLGGSLLRRQDLGDLEVGVRGLFVVAVLALATAAILAVAGVLRPQPRLAISEDQLREFNALPLVAAPKMEIQGRMLTTAIESLLAERRLNSRKAAMTQVAAAALVVGFATVAALAVVVGVT